MAVAQKIRCRVERITNHGEHVYTVDLVPEQRERLRITYSVQGPVIARMEKELAEGKFVWIKLTYGEFIIQGSSDVVLFIGDTGITAFTAFFDGLTPAFLYQVYLAYGARDSNLLIYRDLVQWRPKIGSQLKPFYFFEQDTDGESVARSEIVGRLSVSAMWQRIENPMAATY
ncbi:MAG: hypothetical protein WAV28_06980 [Sedimentisphaerales bacterium]